MRSIRGTRAACEGRARRRSGNAMATTRNAGVPARVATGREMLRFARRPGHLCSGALAGGPSEEAASQHVCVNVIHALSTVVARVQDGPEAALGDAFRARHITSQQ